MAIVKNKSDISRSEQIVLNRSVDDQFDIIAVELIGYDSSSDTLKRILVADDGELLSKMRAKTGSDSFDYVEMDAVTHALISETTFDSAINDGNHFYMENYIELDTNDEYYVKLVVPDTQKLIHFQWVIDSGGVLTTEFYEGASGGMTGGTAGIPLNSNRNSSNTSVLTITQNVTAPTNTGITIAKEKVGGATWKNVTGGSADSEEKIILKNNTTYCRKFLSGSDNNIIHFKAMWSEIEPK